MWTECVITIRRTEDKAKNFTWLSVRIEWNKTNSRPIQRLFCMKLKSRVFGCRWKIQLREFSSFIDTLSPHIHRDGESEREQPYKQYAIHRVFAFASLSPVSSFRMTTTLFHIHKWFGFHIMDIHIRVSSRARSLVLNKSKHISLDRETTSSMYKWKKKQLYHAARSNIQHRIYADICSTEWVWIRIEKWK